MPSVKTDRDREGLRDLTKTQTEHNNKQNVCHLTWAMSLTVCCSPCRRWLKAICICCTLFSAPLPSPWRQREHSHAHHCDTGRSYTLHSSVFGQQQAIVTLKPKAPAVSSAPNNFHGSILHTCRPQNCIFRNKNHQNPEHSIIFLNTSANVSPHLWKKSGHQILPENHRAIYIVHLPYRFRTAENAVCWSRSTVRQFNHFTTLLRTSEFTQVSPF